MRTDTADPANLKSNPSETLVQAPPDGVERRRRKRVKVSAQVRLRSKNSPEIFEEICKTVDVSRDGLLFVTPRAGYSIGMRVDVKFPYSPESGSPNQGQPAEVTRVAEGPEGAFSVGVQFIAAKAELKSGESASAASATAGATPKAAAAVRGTHQTVVLAVESDQRTADIMRSLLQQDGYTVIVVPDSHAALAVLRTTVPAVVLGQVESADMSGHDLCLIIKRDERLEKVPVILLTRSARPADYSAGHAVGAVVCMAKPYKPERLLHVVRLVAPPPALRAFGARLPTRGTDRKN